MQIQEGLGSSKNRSKTDKHKHFILGSMWSMEYLNVQLSDVKTNVRVGFKKKIEKQENNVEIRKSEVPTC